MPRHLQPTLPLNDVRRAHVTATSETCHAQAPAVDAASEHRAQGVCHRDLKLDNTLLDGSTPPRLKICDFGFSKSEWFDSQPKSMVGTRNYFAPEVPSFSWLLFAFLFVQAVDNNSQAGAEQCSCSYTLLEE